MFAFTAFNKPDEKTKLCTKVNIDIQDKATNGFIDTHEIKNRLEKSHIYPLKMSSALPGKRVRVFISAMSVTPMLRSSFVRHSKKAFPLQVKHAPIILSFQKMTSSKKALSLNVRLLFAIAMR